MIKAIDVRNPKTRQALQGFDLDRVHEYFGDSGMRTPFLILRRSDIRENLERLAAALPGVTIHYAVKSNNHPAILEEVAKNGHKFDISSYQEMLQAVEAGGHVDEMIHSNPIKSPYEIADAIKSGISLFVIDNPDEIDKFIPYAGKVRLLIRFKVDNSNAVVNLSIKFGCAPEEVLGLAEKIRDKGLDFYGLAFHVGSQCQDNNIYLTAVDIASDLISNLDKHGLKTSFLDIGGGFPVPYTAQVPDIAEFCRPIRERLTEKIDPNIRLACEPGRFISATAVTLVASIIGKSIRSGKRWYFLDDGVYGSFSGRLYDHCTYQILTNRNTTWKRSVLAGPTCDSFDVIYRNIVLPPLSIGDLLLFPAMGAYTSVSASSFNCLRKAEYIVTE
ncbi:Ornithine decarboxylase [Candidatus Zixiibacteriota bacterium]|nr:Ornithine decarboxylase [candidate division Zixibacteria bacterium]